MFYNFKVTIKRPQPKERRTSLKTIEADSVVEANDKIKRQYPSSSYDVWLLSETKEAPPLDNSAAHELAIALGYVKCVGCED